MTEIYYGTDGVGGTPVLIKEEPRTVFPDANAEYSPTVRTVEGGSAREMPGIINLTLM